MLPALRTIGFELNSAVVFRVKAKLAGVLPALFAPELEPSAVDAADERVDRHLRDCQVDHGVLPFGPASPSDPPPRAPDPDQHLMSVAFAARGARLVGWWTALLAAPRPATA